MLDINKKIILPNKLNFEYFNNNAPHLWDYKSFKDHKTAQTAHPPRNKRIRATYEEAIKDIRNLSCVEDEIRDYLDSLIKDMNSKVILNEYCKLTWSTNLLSYLQGDKEKNQVVNQYINYGNFGNQGPSEIGNINMNINSTKKRKYSKLNIKSACN